MRFLHLADIHLDAPFATLDPSLRGRLRAAAREAFENAVDLALEEDVHAVLVAGDLFHGGHISFATERFLLDQVQRLEEKGKRIVYTTGNHDPHGGSRPGRPFPWPANVTVIGTEEPVTVEIAGENGRTVGRVTGAGHGSSRVTRDLSRTFPRPAEDLPHVGLLHTQVGGAREAGEHHPYAPSDLRHLRGSGFGYWALGHIHRRQTLSSDPPIHYPGCLMGLDPGERGPKGGLLVDLGRRGDPQVEFRSLAPVRWEEVEISGLGEIRSLDGLVRAIARTWKDHLGEEGGGSPEPGPASGWLLRVLLAGPTPLWREFRSRENLAELEDVVREDLGLLRARIRAEATAPPVAPGEFLEREDVLGEALRLLRDLRSGRTRLPPDWITNLASTEILGTKTEDLDLEELLREADRELTARMTTEDEG